MGKSLPPPPAYNAHHESEAIEMMSRKVEPTPFADELLDREPEYKDKKRKLRIWILIGVVVFLLAATAGISVWTTRSNKRHTTEQQAEVYPASMSTPAASFTTTVMILQSGMTSTSTITSTSVSTSVLSSTSSTSLEDISSDDSSTTIHTIVVTTYTDLSGSNSGSSELVTTTALTTETITPSKNQHTLESTLLVSVSVTTVVSPSPYTVIESSTDNSFATTTATNTQSLPTPFASHLSQPHVDTTTSSICDFLTLTSSFSSDSITSSASTSSSESMSTSTTSACNPTSTYVDVDYCHWVTDCNIEAMRAQDKCYQFCANKICQNGEKDQKNMPQGQLHCCGLCGCFG